ncbi:MAG: tyrosine-type recombinase/integrase [bacterium]
MKTLYELLDEYLEWRRSLKMSPYTIAKNKYVILPFLRWLESDYQVASPIQIRKEHLYHWQKYLPSMTTRKGYPLKPRTINATNESIRGLLTYAEDLGYVPQGMHKALRNVKTPQMLPGSVLTHAQMRAMLMRIPTSDAKGYRDRAMLEVLYSSGIRARELLGLNVEDIDFHHHTMVVTGKGNKQRAVPIGKTAFKYLEIYIVAIRPYLLKEKEEKALFLNPRGKRFHYRSLVRCIHAYTKKARLDNVSPHTFRRSCTTELIRGGANMYHVKELLGHESLETLKHYAKLTINDLKKTHQRCHPREKDGN